LAENGSTVWTASKVSVREVRDRFGAIAEHGLAGRTIKAAPRGFAPDARRNALGVSSVSVCAALSIAGE
jgi:hypothetical protein